LLASELFPSLTNAELRAGEISGVARATQPVIFPAESTRHQRVRQLPEIVILRFAQDDLLARATSQPCRDDPMAVAGEGDMQLISVHDGQLQIRRRRETAQPQRGYVTGLSALDALAPGGRLQRSAVHELLTDPADGRAMVAAAIFAMSIVQPRRAPGDPFPQPPPQNPPALVWCDPDQTLYPPALAGMGFDLDRVFLLRPRDRTELIWAVAESLRCPGVGVTVAALDQISRVEARRFQLAAETGGGVGIFLRYANRHAAIYAAATRWLVRPCEGSRTTQRWSVQLIHGHGGRVGQTVFLEWDRETDLMRATDGLADRAGAAPAAAARRVGA